MRRFTHLLLDYRTIIVLLSLFCAHVSKLYLAWLVPSQDTFGLYFGRRKLYFAFLSMNNKFLVSID